jgi:hypothetical protein
MPASRTASSLALLTSTLAFAGLDPAPTRASPPRSGVPAAEDRPARGNPPGKGPCGGLPDLRICEPLTRAPAGAAFPLDRGSFTAAGWRIESEQCQIRYDLGRPFKRGVVEFEVKGPLRQPERRILFAAWADQAASETVAQKKEEKNASFHQVRLQENGMMLRLTHRAAGRSFEGLVRDVRWREGAFHHVRATWDTDGGESALWLNGEEIKRGKLDARSAGFRWLFLGRDNYRPQMARAIPGLIFRNFKVYGLE